MDYLFVTALIFILWLAAKKTKKLLRRLEPEEKVSTKRPMIVIKADVNALNNSHLINPPEAMAEEPAPVEAEMPGFTFEVEQPANEAAVQPAAASEPWKEFAWEPGKEIEMSVR